MPIEAFAVTGSFKNIEGLAPQERTAEEVAQELAAKLELIAKRGGEVILQQLVPRPFSYGVRLGYVHDWQIVADMPEPTEQL